MNGRRTVVTGIGLITPLGMTLASNWDALVRGESGISKITRFDCSKLSVQIAGEVKNFTPDPFFSPKEARKMGLFIQYGVAASQLALKDAGLSGRFGEAGDASSIDPTRVGVNVSAGMGGLPEIQEWDRELLAKEKKTITPFFVPMIIPNLISGHVSIFTNAKGPNLCIVTACATSAHSLGEAKRTIERGDADVMISGGSEAVVCELGIVGFASMKALSTRNEAPEKASRPYDKNRDGFVLSEGSAVLVLEELEHARKRGARIYCELAGYGASGDANHITSPCEDGDGAIRAMSLALKDATCSTGDVQYVNTHGTSTPVGDAAEAQAIAKIWKSDATNLHISSTKSMTGHLLGATGSFEAAVCALTITNGIVPPTINLENLDENCSATGLNFTPNQAVEKKVHAAMTNSFGFGGTNATLLFRKLK